MTRDLEGAKNGDNDQWELGNAEMMDTVFNEMVELKSSFRAVKTSVLALFALVILLVVVTMSASFASLVGSNKVSVDVDTNRMTTGGGQDVGTIGLGQSFRLPMYNFPAGSYDDVNVSHPNPYVCVGVPSVWKRCCFGCVARWVFSYQLSFSFAISTFFRW